MDQASSVKPAWLETAMTQIQSLYPNDRFEAIRRKQIHNDVQAWRMKCLDCPGKLYAPGPGETLTNFQIHLRNRLHRTKVHKRTRADAPRSRL